MRCRKGVVHPGPGIVQDGVGGDDHIDAGLAGFNRALDVGQNTGQLVCRDANVTCDLQQLIIDARLRLGAHIISHHQAPKSRGRALGAHERRCQILRHAQDASADLRPQVHIDRCPARGVVEIFLAKIQLPGRPFVKVNRPHFALHLAPLCSVCEIHLVKKHIF